MVAKKTFWIFLGILVIIACSRINPVAVKSAEITPVSGQVGAALTAEIEVEGEGIIYVRWSNAVYDSVKVAWIDEIAVGADGIYLSDYNADSGWYWIDIFDEEDSLLWHTDSVFCGENSSLPIVDFSADPQSGAEPLTVEFHNNSSQDNYTWCEWDFGDGEISTEWEPIHVFEDTGTYQVNLIVSNLAGSDKDSIAIEVYEPLSVASVEINPSGATTSTTLTAAIGAQGKGQMKVRWSNAVYDSVNTAWTDHLEVDGDDIYSSIYDSDLGWYWIDIFDDSDSLLWHTDSVFCGPDTALPVIVFSPDWEYGPYPLTITFFNDTEQTEYTRALWDFDDQGETDTVWDRAKHTYQNPGEYWPKLHVSNLAGASVDSTLIFVW